MQSKTTMMFYLSAALAIIGATGYQYFVKLVPTGLNPIISIIAVYLAVLVFGIVLLPIFPAEGGLMQQIRQLNWVQLAVAVSVLLIELGFLLMYRYGWNLSTGNLITSVIVNLVLVVLGVILVGEKVNLVNAAGIALCIIGVVLVSYRG
jgi:drug/metabolite transporter (DMT)-like permease